MERVDYKPLNLKKLQEKKSVVVPAKEALNDVEPIMWSEEVVSGNKKVLLVEKDKIQEKK